MMRPILLCLLLLILTGCENVPMAMKPMSWIFRMMPQGGSYGYQEGWKDGCETGISSMTNDYYRAFYTYKVNVELIHNQDYYRAWKDLFNFCRHYAYGTLKEANLRLKLPNAPISEPAEDALGLFNFGGNPAKSGFFDNP